MEQNQANAKQTESKTENHDEMKRDGFIFYRSYFDAIQELESMNDRLSAYEAIFGYALNGTEPTLTGTPAAVYRLAKPTLEASRRKAANGRLGGKSRSQSDGAAKQTASKHEANRKQTESNREAIKDKGYKIKDKGQGIERESEVAPQPSPAKEKKCHYGERGNVMLTESEYNALCRDYPNADEAIAYFDEYIAYNGYSKKSHYLALKNWVFDALRERAVRRAETEQREKRLSAKSSADSPPTDGERLKFDLEALFEN